MDVVSQIVADAQGLGVDPRLALEVAIEESNANPNVADGAAGEIGIFQLLPSTAADLGVDPRDPVQNIQGGITYLAQQLAKFGDPAKALAAYNAGPGTVSAAIAAGGDWLSRLPLRTQSYVTNILNRVNTQYQADAGGTDFNATVGGISVATLGWIVGAAIFGYLLLQAAE